MRSKPQTRCRSRRLAWFSLLAIASMALGGCTGTPQPVPIPDPSRFRSTAVFPGSEVDVVVVGLLGATAGRGSVSVRRVSDGSQVEVTASDGGSFWATIAARADDVLEVRYAGSQPARYTVPVMGVTTPMPPRPIAGVPPIEAAGAGRVRVRGEVDSGVLRVLVVSTLSGDVDVTTVDAQQRFEATVSAAPGETIEAYAGDEILGAVWQLTAP